MYPSDFNLQALILIFGVIVGSFLNAIITRLPSGQSLSWPCKYCHNCSVAEGVRDNLPLLTYYLNKGNCPYCGVKLSRRYPTVEIVTAILFVAAELRFGWIPSLLVLRVWPLLSLFICIAFIDFEIAWIPVQLAIVGILIGISNLSLFACMSRASFVLGGVLNTVIFFAFIWPYQKLRYKQNPHRVPYVFFLMLGVLIGPVGSLVAMALALILSVLVWGWARKNRQPIPIGTLLIVGALLYYFSRHFAALDSC